MAKATGPSKADEEKWQAESDARAMQQMGEIIGDPKRHERAKKKMDEMISDMEKSKKAMEIMAGAKMEYKNSPREGKGNG